MQFRRLLDDRFVEVALDARRMAPARAMIGLALVVLVGFTISWTSAFAWGVALTVTEAWSAVAVWRLQRSPSKFELRLQCFGVNLVGVPVWMVFGVMLWLGPNPAGWIAAVTFWAGQLLYIQNFAFRSPIALIQLGLPSILAPIILPILCPHFQGADQILVLIMLSLCIGHAVNSALVGAKSAASLTSSQQKLRGLFELAPVGIALTDLNGNYVEFNQAFCDICGYTEAELKVLDYWKLTPLEYSEAEAEQLESLMRTGRYGPYEKEYVRKDGSRVPLRLNGMLIEGSKDEKFIWSIVEDITEQRQAETVLIEARNAAEAATVAKSEFLANMSHEIRTPLTGMLGFAGLLSGLKDLPPIAQQYVDRIAVSGQALLAVVNDILDFSKLDAERIELDPHPFDPDALAAEAIALVAAEAERKGLYVRKQVDGRLPNAVFADSSRIRQVLLNLLTNAVKFTGEGGVTVTVGYADGAAGRLLLSVTDTGAGIPADRLHRLFQRFSQVDGSITRQHGGTGLGLAISKGLTELMGGRIEVGSQEGVGSTFRFFVDAPEADRVAVTEPDGALIGADFSEASARLLVVDDVVVNRELVRIMLAPFGVDLTEAASGAEAVAAAMSDAFDLILMDLQMPGMDGLSATRAIRQTDGPNRRTPILALSANVLPEHRALCKEAGMDDHIAKPISPSELIGKIAQWLDEGGAAEPDQAVA